MDIIEFFNRSLFSKRTSRQIINLHPMQQVILKLIYGESLSTQEIELATENGLPTERINYTQTVGILGRRTGKDFLLSIIAAYEAYKLVELGRPYEHYNIGTGSPITILMLSASAMQGRVLFNEVLNTIRNSSYFKNCWKSPRHGLITFKTKEVDVQIQVGTASGGGLIGTNCHTLLCSEMGAYTNQEIVQTLTPAVVTFNGKTIIFSTPGRNGGDLLYTMYAYPSPSRLSFALPTWVVNPSHSEAALRVVNPHMNGEAFMREYGATFANIPFEVQTENVAPEEELEKTILTKFTHSYPFSRQLELGE